MQTITVQSYFGDKTMTRIEYTQRWVDHAKEFYKLDLELGYQIVELVTQRADKEFDNILAEQTQ